MDAFIRHSWPGNVRELVNYMMRLVVCSKGPQITPDDLRKSDIRLSSSGEWLEPEVQLPVASAPESAEEHLIRLVPDTMLNMENEIIRWHLDKYDGNRAQICDALQISRTTLWKRLKQIGHDTAGIPA
jgi:DNA-binding NtrC family response regulator